ncbi:hypothetical protein GUJ93_ZPchr1146g33302 [Zizania palustris]|uniref:Uncharacterized protein n=1 Tax=Zizania palustris TaxID=103762 RepID=A0A8J5QZ01_ZIZPA|nr:hypothetical protein GUJ93_ZPchr1146g33302 [Zizania palustris]
MTARNAAPKARRCAPSPLLCASRLACHVHTPHRRAPARLRCPRVAVRLLAAAHAPRLDATSPAPLLVPNRAPCRLGSQPLQPRATACRLACCAWPLAFHRSSGHVFSPRVLSRPHVPSSITRTSSPTPSVQTRAPKYQPKLPTPHSSPHTTFECLSS